MTTSYNLDVQKKVLGEAGLLFKRLKTVLILILLVPPFLAAQTGEIKALLIGNDSYDQSGMFPSLRGTPRRDVEAVEGALRSAGVAKKNIVMLYNLDYDHFNNAVYEFRQALSSTDSAIFYYSGHGYSTDDHAFLVPVDFKLGPARRSAVLRSISLDHIKKSLSKAKMRGLIIDACRTDIPLLKQASGVSSAIALANLYDTRPAGSGELIAFATQGGRPAKADAPSAALSFFTYYFVDRLRAAPLDLGTIARQAQIATSLASNRSQEPEVRDNLQGYLEFPASSRTEGVLRTPPIGRPDITAAEVPNYDSTLPIACPKNDELYGGWQLGDGETSQQYRGLISSGMPLHALNTTKPLTIPVNNLLRGNISITEVTLTSDLMAKTKLLVEEIDAVAKKGPPIRSINGEIKVRRTYTVVARHSDADPDRLLAAYTSYIGSVQSQGNTVYVAISEMSRSAQDFIAEMDGMARKSMDEACESAVKRIEGSTP